MCGFCLDASAQLYTHWLIGTGAGAERVCLRHLPRVDTQGCAEVNVRVHYRCRESMLHHAVVSAVEAGV